MLNSFPRVEGTVRKIGKLMKEFEFTSQVDDLYLIMNQRVLSRNCHLYLDEISLN